MTFVLLKTNKLEIMSTDVQFGHMQRVEANPHTPPPTERPVVDEGNLTGGGLFFDYVMKIAIYLTAFLVPVFYFFSSDTIGLSKHLLLTLLAFIILLAWVGKVIATGSFSWRKTRLLWPALALGVIAVASTLTSAAPWVSFYGDVGRFAFSTMAILAYLIVFFAALENMTRKEARWTAVAAVAASVVATLISFLQFAGVHVLPGAFTENELFTPLGSLFALALFSAFSLPIVIDLFGSVRALWKRVVLAVIGLAQLTLLLIVNFDAAWISLAIALLVYVGLISYRQGFFSSDWARQRRIIVPLLILVVSVLMWLLPSAPALNVVQVPAEISPSYSASWNVVKNAWSGNFILGSGPETFPYEYAQAKSATLNQTNFWGVNFSDANAEMLTWLANLGLLGALGLLAFIVFFVIGAFYALKRMGDGEAGLAMGLFSAWVFILASKFFYPTTVSLEIFFWLLPALFMARVTASEGLLQTYQFKAGSMKTLVAFVLSIVLLVVGIGGLYLTVQRFVSERAYAAAVSGEVTADSLPDRLQNAARAIQTHGQAPRYYRTFSQLALARVNVIVGEIGQRQGQQQQATAEESQQVQNLTAQAITALQQARQLDPENVSLLIDVAESYRAMNAYVDGANDFAAQVYERAVELEPVNPFIRTQLAQTYLVQGGFFANQNVRSGEPLEKAQAQLERAVELNPNYSNARYFLGLIYDRQGNRQGAIEQFERVAALNPNNQEVQIILTNLRAGRQALAPPAAGDSPPLEGEEAEGVPAGGEEQQP